MKKILKHSKEELLGIKCVLRVINKIKFILYEEQYNDHKRIRLLYDLYEIISAIIDLL